MDEPDPFAAPLVGITSRGSSRGGCGGWKRLRRSCLLAALLVLAALQVIGAFRLRGNAGLELLLAAVAPGAAAFWLLHWAAGKKRLSTLASLEFVALGAVFSVLVAVGLELISLLIFRNELRLCMPIQSPSVRTVLLQKDGAQSIGKSDNTRLPATLAFPENASSVDRMDEVSLVDRLPFPVKWFELSPFTQLLRHAADLGMASTQPPSLQSGGNGDSHTFVDWGCGVGARGIISSLAPLLLPQPFSWLHQQPHGLFERPFLQHAAEHPLNDAFYTETFVCIAFIFFYMVVCIGFAEEVAKALAMFAVRPALVPPVSILEQNAAIAAAVSAINGTLDGRIAHESNACGVYVKHPLAMVMAGCCAALGFATMENVSYVFSPRSAIDTAFATAWVRAFTAIPSHTANTGIAACFIASVAARAVAAGAPSFAASSAAAENLADAQSVAVAEAAGRGESAENLQSVGDVREVESTPGSHASFVSWTEAVPSSAAPAERVAFFWSSLLPSAVLPTLLHGAYDAALTLTTLAQGKSDGGSYTGLGWLLLALLAWMLSLAIFIKRWCAIKRFEDFWVYFHLREGGWHRPSQVVPYAGLSGQLLQSSAQQPTLHEQQLFHQQQMLQRQIQQQQLLQEQQQQLLHQQMLQYHLQQQLMQQGFMGAQLVPSSQEALGMQNSSNTMEARRAQVQLTCVAGGSPTSTGYERQMRQYAPVLGHATGSDQQLQHDTKYGESDSSP